MVDLDRHGTELWNLAARLHRDAEAASRLQLTLCLLRVFAFYLVDSGHSQKVGAPEQRIRILKVAIKAAKIALDRGELDLGGKVLERAAHYVGLFAKDKQRLGPEDVPIVERLNAEYHVSRIAIVGVPHLTQTIA
jgi:hypothetical protein